VKASQPVLRKPHDTCLTLPGEIICSVTKIIKWHRGWTSRRLQCCSTMPEPYGLVHLQDMRQTQIDSVACCTPRTGLKLALISRRHSWTRASELVSNLYSPPIFVSFPAVQYARTFDLFSRTLHLKAWTSRLGEMEYCWCTLKIPCHSKNFSAWLIEHWIELRIYKITSLEYWAKQCRRIPLWGLWFIRFNVPSFGKSKQSVENSISV